MQSHSQRQRHWRGQAGWEGNERICGARLAGWAGDPSFPTNPSPCLIQVHLREESVFIHSSHEGVATEKSSQSRVMGSPCKPSCLRLRQEGYKLEACLIEEDPVSGKQDSCHPWVTHVYFRMPSSFEVQIMMLLSADPDAKRLPKGFLKRKSSHVF